MTRRTGPSAERGQTRQAITAKALREAWERLRLGAPTHPDLAGADWQLSITTVCLEGEMQ